jgi:hypothetical protein
MSTLALTLTRPLPGFAPWRPTVAAEPDALLRIALAGVTRRLLGVSRALWALLCGLVFGTAAVCVGGAVCGGLAVWFIARGVWTLCWAIAAGTAADGALAAQLALEA